MCRLDSRYHIRDTGEPYVTKLANNIVGLGTLAAVCEGLVFAKRAGADLNGVVNAFSGGAADSWMVENLAPRILARDFEPGFTIDLAEKDLRLVLESSADMKLPLFTTPLVGQLFRSAQQSGFGHKGTQAYFRALERLAGDEAAAPEDKS